METSLRQALSEVRQLLEQGAEPFVALEAMADKCERSIAIAALIALDAATGTDFPFLAWCDGARWDGSDIFYDYGVSRQKVLACVARAVAKAGR